MSDHLRRLLALRMAPVRTAHAWFDGEAGAGGAAPPPAGDGGSPATGAAGVAAGEGEPPAGEGGTPDLATALKELREARREAASFRTKLKSYEDADQAAKQAQMTESEKLQAQIADLTKGIAERDERLKAQDLRAAVQRAAAKHGFADPEDAMALLPAGSIEYTEDGKPRNLDHLLGEIIRSKPYLKASYTQPPDLGQGGRGAAPGTLTRSELAKMSVEQVMALPPAEVDAAMARG